jgi:hypothetical protein
MSKLTIHSMIKKSNRISVKISNVFGLNGIMVSIILCLDLKKKSLKFFFKTVDEEFNRLEAKFHYYEKLIKSFSKDSIQHLANLKDFFKVQSITAESVQEYYGDYKSDQVLQYVKINAEMLNEIYTKNV